jgi:hypothetical protein
MVMYRTSQQQMNDVLSFGMSIMFMAVMLGLVKSLLLDALKPAPKPELLPRTIKENYKSSPYSLAQQYNPPKSVSEGLRSSMQEELTAADWYRRRAGYAKTRGGDQVTARLWGHVAEEEDIHYSEFKDRLIALEKPDKQSTVSAFLPQVMIEGGEKMPPEYRYLTGWLEGALPDYSLLTLLPAVEPEVKERKIDAVLKQLKDGVESIQESDRFRLFLSTMAKFHDYSIGNLILIMIQKPDAIHAAGFNTWKDLGRWVKAGEKGIAILAPVMPPRPTCPRCGAKLSKGVRFCPQCGQEVEVEEETGVAPRYFKVVYVFDISQTEGKPLPEFEVPVLTGEANEELLSKVLALAKAQGLEVSFELRPYQDPAVKGQYSGKSIWIRPEESRAQQLKTLLHEVAHYYSEGVFRIPRRDAETIAESAAFAVGAHFGFDTGVRSFPYVALWAQDKKVLEQNLASIRKVATSIIEALEGAT